MRVQYFCASRGFQQQTNNPIKQNQPFKQKIQPTSSSQDRTQLTNARAHPLTQAPGAATSAVATDVVTLKMERGRKVPVRHCADLRRSSVVSLRGENHLNASETTIWKTMRARAAAGRTSKPAPDGASFRGLDEGAGLVLISAQ